MALIDRETISIPLYVFIISRPSRRRFNIETSTWDGGWIGEEGVAGVYTLLAAAVVVDEEDEAGQRFQPRWWWRWWEENGRGPATGVGMVGVDGRSNVRVSRIIK